MIEIEVVQQSVEIILSDTPEVVIQSAQIAEVVIQTDGIAGPRGEPGPQGVPGPIGSEPDIQDLAGLFENALI